MSALEDNSVGGIPTGEQRGSETTPQQIHQEGAQYVKEATQVNQQSMDDAREGTIDSEPRQQHSHEHHSDKAHGAKAENPDSIPSAGGEKLGGKHWGESKVVPELPPKQDSDADQGVSSKAGQPNAEVADNTATNTGGATSGPHGDHSSDAHKPGMMDKVKHTLHMGKK